MQLLHVTMVHSQNVVFHYGECKRGNSHIKRLQTYFIDVFHLKVTFLQLNQAKEIHFFLVFQGQDRGPLSISWKIIRWLTTMKITWMEINLNTQNEAEKLMTFHSRPHTFLIEVAYSIYAPESLPNREMVNKKGKPRETTWPTSRGQAGNFFFWGWGGQ